MPIQRPIKNTLHDRKITQRAASYPLAEQTVMVAIPIEPAMAASTAEEAGFGIAFRIKFGNLETAACTVSDERNIVFLAHWMRERDIIFILNMFTLGLVIGIRCFSFQRRQRDATARNHRRTHRLKNIATDWANIELCFEHIG